MVLWLLLGEGVAKQNCGSCRYYQEAGLAGSGWCLHPQRKTSNDVMIMVRRSELACRNGWAESLWEPATALTDSEVPPHRQPPGLGPLPPASFANMQSLLAAESHAPEEHEGEDVLLSEARLVSEARQAWEPPPTRPTAGFDPRTAIFRAREAYRDRARARSAAERQALSLEPLASDRDVERRAAEVEDFESLELAARQRAATTGVATGLERAGHANGSHLGAAIAGGDVRGPDPWRLPPSFNQGSVVDSAIIAEDPGLGMGMQPGQQNEVCAPDAIPGLEPAAVDLLEPRRERPEPMLPHWFRQDLPRVCRACRDYRPAGDGQRGWCANAWAFTHSRLVGGDDMAPCHSAIGDWWAPVDDVWLVAADVSAHGRATPLLDQLIAQERPARRRS